MITPEDRQELSRAKLLLERPNLAVRVANTLGYPIERGIAMLPGKVSGALESATHEALERAMQVAVNSLGSDRAQPPSNRLHRALVMMTGAASGMVGLPALLIELPLSTTVMLRSIAEIARSEGEDVDSIEGRLACLEVFALGGRSPRTASTETGYFTIRAALAHSMREAAKYIAERGLAEEGAPVLVRFLAAIAARFQIVVSQKVLAQATPFLGAAGGAAINSIFIEHFQEIARGHFIIRRLERKYGPDEVRAAYSGTAIEQESTEDVPRRLSFRRLLLGR